MVYNLGGQARRKRAYHDSKEAIPMFDVKDIKSKIDQMVEKIKTDDTLKEQFK